MQKQDEILVEVSGLSKKFCKSLKRSMLYGVQDVTKSIVTKGADKSELRKDEFWAVRDINFTLRRGECLGLIGRNGAGKSTLLKMLNGLIRPDAGSIKMRGKVGALIELGAGFNPILTGRENIYVNGQILGFSKSEIERKLDAILEFAEIGSFIDSPVQNYSSGMRVRLGFAIAAQMEPDILIIDEVLAVGDLGFVLKCFNVIDNILPKTAVIFVSHSMQQVSRICTTIGLMETGKFAYCGNNVSAGIDMYYSNFSSSGNQVIFSDGKRGEFVSLEIADAGKLNNVSLLKWNDDLSLKIHFATEKTIVNPCIVVTFMDKEQRPVAICLDTAAAATNAVEKDGRLFYSVNLQLAKIQFSQGFYSITLSVSETEKTKPVFRIQNVAKFQVTSDRQVWPPFELKGIWK